MYHHIIGAMVDEALSLVGEHPEKIQRHRLKHEKDYLRSGLLVAGPRSWVRELIYHPQLMGPRAKSFRWWYVVFQVVQGLGFVVFLYLMMCTVLSVYVAQGWPVPDNLHLLV